MEDNQQPDQKRRRVKDSEESESGSSDVTKEETDAHEENHTQSEDPAFVNSVWTMPDGYHFRPRDDELIRFYLERKVFNQPLPRHKIHEVDLYQHTPADLIARYPSYGEDESYFFTPRDRKYPKGTRPKRGAGDGFWKATGGDKDIKLDGRVIGHKKVLVFYRGKPPRGEKTDWIMQEFRLANPPERRQRDGANDMRLDDCVLCRVYNKAVRSDHQAKQQGIMPNSSKPKAKSKPARDAKAVKVKEQVPPVVQNLPDLPTPRGVAAPMMPLPHQNQMNIFGGFRPNGSRPSQYMMESYYTRQQIGRLIFPNNMMNIAPRIPVLRNPFPSTSSRPTLISDARQMINEFLRHQSQGQGQDGQSFMNPQSSSFFTDGRIQVQTQTNHNSPEEEEMEEVEKKSPDCSKKD